MGDWAGAEASQWRRFSRDLPADIPNEKARSIIVIMRKICAFSKERSLMFASCSGPVEYFGDQASDTCDAHPDQYPLRSFEVVNAFAKRSNAVMDVGYVLAHLGHADPHRDVVRIDFRVERVDLAIDGRNSNPQVCDRVIGYQCTYTCVVAMLSCSRLLVSSTTLAIKALALLQRKEMHWPTNDQ
jgi:hypothetical protein